MLININPVKIAFRRMKAVFVQHVGHNVHVLTPFSEHFLKLSRWHYDATCTVERAFNNIKGFLKKGFSVTTAVIYQ